MSPEDVMLIINVDGEKFYINLWQAIEEGRLLIKVNSLERAKVTDAAGDCEENHEGMKPITGW